jgi:hypothetical protein
VVLSILQRILDGIFILSGVGELHTNSHKSVP